MHNGTITMKWRRSANNAPSVCARNTGSNPSFTTKDRVVAALFAAMLLMLGLTMGSRAHADTSYWRLATDRIVVVSDGSAKRCENVAKQFLTFERLMRDLADVDADSQFPPLSVYVLSNADASRYFLSAADKRQEDTKNMRIYSKYLPGRDANVAAIVDSSGIDEPLQSIFLLYAEGLVTSGAGRAYPAWYQVGVANITNGILIRYDGSVLLDRDGPFAPDVEKSNAREYDLAMLLSTTSRDVTNGGDWRAFTKRAREFAQYGLLTGADRRAKYRELAMLMRQGMPALEATVQAFGMPLAQLSKDFDDGRWRRELQFKVPAPAAVPAVPGAERVESAQVPGLLQVVADRVAQEPAHP